MASFDELGLDEYSTLSAVELARRVARSEVSPVQLLECAVELARRWEPTVNAYVEIVDDEARRRAVDLEAEARAGRRRGPLHGVPIASKDNFLIAGHTIRKGSRLSAETPATATSPMLARLVDGGANVIGRTTMPEHGWKGTGISPLTGVTRNPWDPSRNPGGSSAGSAVTVATGAVSIATGSDAGGSIRIPASFCGVVGFKPTLSAIPVWPATANENLSHAGPLTRSVADARVVFELTRGFHPDDPQSALALARPPRADRRPRVAVVRTPFGIAPEHSVAADFERAVRTLEAADLAELEEVQLDHPLPRAIFEMLWIAGRGFSARRLAEQHAEQMDAGLVSVVERSRALELDDYLEILAARRRYLEWAFHLLERWDFLVMPTMPLRAFDAAAETPPGGEADAPLPWITWTPYTYPFNISGQPALSLPMPTDGLPCGLQIVGPWGADDALLAFAQRCEQALASTRSAVVAPRPVG